MTPSSTCTRCGAPIYSCPKPGEPNAIPETVFTCPCHKWLQLPEVKSLPYTFIPYQQPIWNPFIWYDCPVNSPPGTVFTTGQTSQLQTNSSVNTR